MPISRSRIIILAISTGAVMLPGCILEEGKSRQREAVRRVLFDPESATFRDEAKSAKNVRIWCGHANAKNRFGGMVGFRRYIVTIAENPLPSSFDAVEFEPAAGGQPSMQETFNTNWEIFCS